MTLPMKVLGHMTGGLCFTPCDAYPICCLLLPFLKQTPHGGYWNTALKMLHLLSSKEIKGNKVSDTGLRA